MGVTRCLLKRATFESIKPSIRAQTAVRPPRLLWTSLKKIMLERRVPRETGRPQARLPACSTGLLDRRRFSVPLDCSSSRQAAYSSPRGHAPLWDHRAFHGLHCANALPVAEALFDSKNLFSRQGSGSYDSAHWACSQQEARPDVSNRQPGFSQRDQHADFGSRRSDPGESRNLGSRRRFNPL